MKPWLLRLHRWVTLVFALPLAVVILTGLVLSVEPSLTIVSGKAGLLNQDKIISWLDEHDDSNAARSLTHRPWAGTMTIGMADDDDDVVLNTTTGEELAEEAASTSLMQTARRLHETMLLDLGWLVTASTFAMLALIALGLFMGWPRLRNTVSGWHKGMAWFALPLLIVSPLTGLFLAYGISFISPSANVPGSGQMPTLREALPIIAAQHDLSALVNLRPRGSRLTARIVIAGEYRTFTVTSQRLLPADRNWPRLIHEGNWGGHFSALLNTITSVVMLGLLGTGLTIWLRRKLWMRSRAASDKKAVMAS